jgi:hypothetical protein
MTNCRFSVTALTVCLLAISSSLAQAQPNTIANLELWLDASDLSTFTLSGSDITQWRDKSGNNYHATPSGAGFEPNRVAGVLGGQAVVRFNATNANTGDGLVINSPAVFNRNYTIFVVDQYSGAIHGRTLQGRGGSNWLMGKWGNSDAHYANAFVYLPNNGGTTTIGEAIGLPTSSFYTHNGFNTTPTQGFGVNGNPGQLGIANGGTFAESSNADVAEVIAYDRVLNYTERNQVGAYLQTKYGLAGNYNANNSVAVGSFTGGDPGEGLDFAGNFQYAVNVRGPAAGLVGNANFTTDAGLVTAQNEILNWHGPNYGATTNDNNLELVMQSIRWSAAPAEILVNLPGLLAGEDYKLQLLFAESCCDRGFHILSEDQLLVNGFNVQANQGGINNTGRGAVVTQQFIAGDTTLNLRLFGQSGLFSDNNPILNGFTLEFFPDAVATTSTPDGGTIDFQTVFGDGTDVQTLSITNTGEALSKLILNSAAISGDDADDFTLLNFVPGTELDVGETLDLLVQFTGDKQVENLAVLDIHTNLGTLFGSLDGQTLSFNLNHQAIPEPATITMWAMFGAGAIGYCAWRKRQRRG